MKDEELEKGLVKGVGMLRKDNSPQRSKYDLILTMAEEEEIHRTMDAVNINRMAYQ